jgi:hypothetical protein
MWAGEEWGVSMPQKEAHLLPSKSFAGMGLLKK